MRALTPRPAVRNVSQCAVRPGSLPPPHHSRRQQRRASKLRPIGSMRADAIRRLLCCYKPPHSLEPVRLPARTPCATSSRVRGRSFSSRAHLPAPSLQKHALSVTACRCMILSCPPCISPLLRPISLWRQLWPPPPRRILALFRASHQILSPARSPAPHRGSTRCVHASHCDMRVPLHSSSSGERGQCAARENQAAAAAGAAAARARRQV